MGMNNGEADIFRQIISCQRQINELDLSRFTQYLSNPLILRLGMHFDTIKCIKLTQWKTCTIPILRSIALTFGKELQKIDLRCCYLTDEMIRVLTNRTFDLKEINLGDCTLITNASLRYLAENCNKTMKSIDLDRCKQLGNEALGWIAATIGHCSLPCKRLEELNLAFCRQISDDGIISLSKHCQLIRYLNLEGCSKLTDVGISAIANACKNLTVLNVSGCIHLTDISCFSLATSCSFIRSLNLSRCSKISDVGLTAASKAFKLLQALNIAGCCRITDLGLCTVADSCKALQLLNVTGCAEITHNGISAIMKRVPFVDAAISYTGFKLRAEHLEMKLQLQSRLSLDVASSKLSAFFRRLIAKKRYKIRLQQFYENSASVTIQRIVRGGLARIGSLMLRHQRVLKRRVIQTLADNQRHGQAYCKKKYHKWKRHMAKLHRKSTRIQAIFRGSLTRRQQSKVKERILLLRLQKRKEALTAVAVRIQSLRRQKLARRLHEKLRLERIEFILNSNKQATKIQCSYRKLMARKELVTLRLAHENMLKLHAKCALVVQKTFRGHIGRKFYLICKKLNDEYIFTMIRATTILQTTYRGRLGRLAFKKALNVKNMRNRAATTIQSNYRRFKTEHWRKLKLNAIREKARYRARIAFEKTKEHITAKLSNMIAKTGWDSCSEDDDTGDHDWMEVWDDHHNCTFYFSPSRGITSFDRPTADDFAVFILGKEIKYADPVDKKQKSGYIQRYNRDKKKHRVLFEDKSRQWLNLRRLQAYIQIFDDQYGVWSMLQTYRNFFAASTIAS